MPPLEASAATSPTRRALLEALKRDGPLDVRSLAARLQRSTMAVRLHLKDLEEKGFVEGAAAKQARGRPPRRFSLTPAAERFFADGHAALALELLSAGLEAPGKLGLPDLLETLTRRKVEAYQRFMPRRGSTRLRLEALARLRSQEGYMAVVESRDRGSFALVENHCPIGKAARACPDLCDAECRVFREVLGDSVTIAREEHLLAGGSRCVYRVEVQRGRHSAR